MTDTNIKNLYAERGRKLKEKEKKAEQNAEEQLRNFYQNSLKELPFFQLPEMRAKFLQLQTRGYIDISKIEPFIYKRPKWFGKKDYYQGLAIDFLAFCLNWTRLEGKSIIINEGLIKEFKTNFSRWKNSQNDDFLQILNLFLESGLCTGNDNDGYWFEPQNDTKDLQSLLQLVDTKGQFYKSKLKEKLHWSDEKIAYTVKLLEEQQIIIPDNEDKNLYWFLEKA